MESLQSELKKIALEIDASPELLPGFEALDEGLSIKIENSPLSYHLIYSERGTERMHKKTSDKDELLYWVFSHVTFEMSVAFELHTRDEGKDCRRIIFDQQLQMLKRINVEWMKKREKEIEYTLMENPYRDSVYI
jgi:hypothetical protein